MRSCVPLNVYVCVAMAHAVSLFPVDDTNADVRETHTQFHGKPAHLVFLQSTIIISHM